MPQEKSAKTVPLVLKSSHIVYKCDSAVFLFPAGVKQGLGKALPNKIPMGRNERTANYGTSVESCSKKLPLSSAALVCGYTGLLHQYSDCGGVFSPLFTTTTVKRGRFGKRSGNFLFSLSAPYNNPAVWFAKDF